MISNNDYTCLVALHSVPGSLYSFRFRFSRISVFYNKKFKKNRETAEFIPDQLPPQPTEVGQYKNNSCTLKPKTEFSFN